MSCGYYATDEMADTSLYPLLASGLQSDERKKIQLSQQLFVAHLESLSHTAQSD